MNTNFYKNWKKAIIDSNYLLLSLTSKRVLTTVNGSIENPEETGIKLAKRLLADGADTILEKIKNNE